jgi:hypothetical protein
MRGELNIRNGVAKVMPYRPVWSCRLSQPELDSALH